MTLMRDGNGDGRDGELVEQSSGLWTRGVPRAALSWSDFRLIAFDMDSTLIASETVDELATLAGCKAQIEAMTHAAMSGQNVDFAENLRARMALLKGVPESLLAKVRDEHMPLTPGCEALLSACKRHGLRCILISGGFTYLADSLTARLGMDEIHANHLEIEAGQLTGRVLAQPGHAFVDAEGKRQRLLDACARLGISAQQAIAVGDGANDVPMLRAAGLAVAFHSKPLVREHADVVIAEGGLDRLLELFGEA